MTTRTRTALGYAAMLAVGATFYFWIRARGEHVTPALPPSPAPTPGVAGNTHVFANVLLALASITLLARFVGGVFRRYLRQPPVMGEIVAGLMLGPSLLGAVWPEAQAFLLPNEAIPSLTVIAKVGVVLFMFLVGLELDPKLVRGNTHALVAISHASIVAPFLLGAAFAVVTYSAYATSNVSFTVFSLFMAVSLSVTAFPVLARILIDRKVQHTRLGAMALTCAAVDDVTAWVILAIVASIASAEAAGGGWTLVWAIGYLAAMLFVVRPLIARFVACQQNSDGPLSRTKLAIVFSGLLLSAFATEAIGIHALFGAFLFGTMLPHEGRLADSIRARLEDVVLVLFLPSFFAITGIRTQVGLLGSAQDWLVCGAVVALATLGKFGGTYAAARLTGIAARQAAALGILMNTRGLMQLIVLNLGLDLGVITPTVFTMLVIMALVTTFATTPILDLLLGKRGFADEPAQGTAPSSRT
jgi:Kef-type K+ transport system membrane component KefB